MVLAIIVTCLSLDVLVTFTYALVAGQGQLVPQILRFSVLLVLCVYTYRRAQWARWVTGILLGLGGIIGIIIGLVQVDSTSLACVVLALGAIYLYAALILLFAPEVRIYFRDQYADTRPRVNFGSLLVFVLLFSAAIGGIVLWNSTRKLPMSQYLEKLGPGMTREEVLETIPEYMHTTNRLEPAYSSSVMRGCRFFEGTNRPDVASEARFVDDTRRAQAAVAFDSNNVIVEFVFLSGH
jgi:hypothetical protein